MSASPAGDAERGAPQAPDDARVSNDAFELAPSHAPVLAQGSVRVHGVAKSEDDEPELELVDPAMTRARTEPMPPEALALAVARAVGTDPPTLRQRIPAPPAPAPAPVTARPTARVATSSIPPLATAPTARPAARVASSSIPPPASAPNPPARPGTLVTTPSPAPTDPPSTRMAPFGTTTILLVPAGDYVALVVPGVMRVTGTREQAQALATLLRDLPPSKH